jgi:hypothetical protein
MSDTPATTGKNPLNNVAEWAMAVGNLVIDGCRFDGASQCLRKCLKRKAD